MEYNLTHEERCVLDRVEAQKEELYKLLSRLVQIDSQNFGGSGREEECAQYMQALYRELGLDTELYCPDHVPGVLEHSLYWPDQQTDQRPNVSGILWGDSKEERVMLAAHTDTMPAGDLSLWEDGPFSGTIRDGKLYGLGACDNKFGLAGAYWALRVMKELGIQLKKTVVLTAYCDEEFGGGNGALAAAIHTPCQVIVNLDGGNYELWATALGGGCFELDLHLNHSSDDCMEVYRVLAAFVQKLEEFAQRRRAELEDNPFYQGTQIAKSAFRVYTIGCVGESHQDAKLAFVIYTTQSKKQIDRELQDVVDALQPMMDRVGVTTQGFVHTTRFFQYSEVEQNHPSFTTMHTCAQDAAKRKVEIKGSCLTDLSAFQGGCPEAACFNFGILRDFSLPGGAHQPNEFVDCQQFLAYTQALTLFLMRYCT